MPLQVLPHACRCCRMPACSAPGWLLTLLVLPACLAAQAMARKAAIEREESVTPRQSMARTASATSTQTMGAAQQQWQQEQRVRCCEACVGVSSAAGQTEAIVQWSGCAACALDE